MPITDDVLPEVMGLVRAACEADAWFACECWRTRGDEVCGGCQARYNLDEARRRIDNRSKAEAGYIRYDHDFPPRVSGAR